MLQGACYSHPGVAAWGARADSLDSLVRPAARRGEAAGGTRSLLPALSHSLCDPAQSVLISLPLPRLRSFSFPCFFVRIKAEACSLADVFRSLHGLHPKPSNDCLTVSRVMKTFLLQEQLLILQLTLLKSCCLTLQGAKTASIQCAAFEVLGDFFLPCMVSVRASCSRLTGCLPHSRDALLRYS